MRALRIITAAVLIAGAVFVFFDRLAAAPGQFLVHADPLEPAEIIVVLAGDGSGNRVKEGVRLLRSGIAPTLMVNGSYALYESRECELGREYAIRAGADAAVVEAFCMNADSTSDEAQLVDGELRARGVETVVVVTSDFHTRRAGSIFDKWTTGEVEYRFAASPTKGFDPENWWRSRPGREIVVIEWIKTVNSWWERPD